MNWQWRPIIRRDPRIDILVVGQLRLLYNERTKLEADIVYAIGQAPIWHAWVSDATSPIGSVAVPRDDYITEASTALKAINDQIAALEA